MTFKEYINQSDAEKCKMFSVLVSEDDIHQSYETYYVWMYNQKHKGRIIVLKILDELFSYLSINNNLWTMDEYGNPYKPTVFKIV